MRFSTGRSTFVPRSSSLPRSTPGVSVVPRLVGETEDPPAPPDLEPPSVGHLEVPDGELAVPVPVEADLKKYAEFTLEGELIWLIPVDDGGATLACSAESDGSIVVARIDPSDSTWDGSATWHELLSSADLADATDWTWYHPNASSTAEAFESISDHWHVYAHGYHWICAALVATSPDGKGTTAFGMVLMQFTFADDETAPTVHNTWLVKTPTDDTDYYTDLLDSTKYRLINPTQDMFMSSHPDGVSIGVQKIPETPGTSSGTTYTPADDEGHTILLVDTSGDVSEVEFTGAGYGHGNGAGVRFWGRGWHVLAPDVFSTQYDSPLRRLRANSDWEPKTFTTVVEEAGYNHSKASEVTKRIYGMISCNVLCYKKTETGSSDDSGEILVDVLRRNSSILKDSSGGGYGPKSMSGTGHRPQMIVWNDYVVVSWDNGSESKIRVETLTIA